jgi:hypothetical protein
VSPYSAARRENDSNHLLDKRLGVYCQDLVNMVPRDVGYVPTSKPSSGHDEAPGSRAPGLLVLGLQVPG